jgi:hypothetical protein
VSFENSPDQTQKDLIDLLTEAGQKVEIIENPDGTVSKILTTDPETTYWKTQLVNSPTFARFVYELKSFENLAYQATNHMSKERAMVLKKQILLIVSAYKYSVDAKSSESLRDKDNSQSTLIDKLNRVKIEKSVNVTGDKTKNLLEILTGKDSEVN